MTKLKTDSRIYTLTGEVIKAPVGAEGEGTKDLTISDVIINSLLAQDKGELSGKEKLERFKLAGRVSEGKEIDLDSKEITLILDCVGRVYTTLIYGRAWELLENQNGHSPEK